MQASSDLDALRLAFRRCFLEYSLEGRRMADLLMQMEGAEASVRSDVISRQQERVRAAQDRYDEARRKYVACVLGELSCSGITRSERTEPDHQQNLS